MANSIDDEDNEVRDALGLYQQYLSQDVLKEEYEQGQGNTVNEDEQSVHSEEVQLYGQFMRSLVTHEDDVANDVYVDFDLPFRGNDSGRGGDPGLLGTTAEDDSFIGKTVVTDSPSKEDDDVDEWLQRSLSKKSNMKDRQKTEEELLVEDAKNFIPSAVLDPDSKMVVDSPKEGSFVWEDAFGSMEEQYRGIKEPTIVSSSKRPHLDQSVLPMYSKSHEKSNNTPDTQKTQEDDDTEPGYSVPWSFTNGRNVSELQDGEKETNRGLKWLSSTRSGRIKNDVEVPSSASSDKPRNRFCSIVGCIIAFFSTPVRCATAFMMTCHFVSSMIALTTFTRRRQCCGDVVDLESQGVFRIVSTVYLLWVLILMLPVVGKGQVRFWTIPNPYFGFILASTLALHSFLWLAVSVFVLESVALTLQLVMVHMKDFRWRWVRLIVSLMPVVLCLAHVFLVFVDSAGQCVVNTREGWSRTVDDACVICTGDDRPLILDKYRDPCVRPSTRYSSDIWGEKADYCGSETNKFCFYAYAGG